MDIKITKPEPTVTIIITAYEAMRISACVVDSYRYSPGGLNLVPLDMAYKIREALAKADLPIK